MNRPEERETASLVAAQHGTILRGIGSFYSILSRSDGNVYTVRAKKKFRRQSISPLVGDEVLFLPGQGEEDGWLEEICPRTSVCIRPPAANITQLLIVIAPVPSPDLLLVDRLMIQARKQGIRCALVISKCDLDTELALRMREEYAQADCRVLPVSSMTGEGCDEVKSVMRGELNCLAGQSGVGKSTLLNRLFGLQEETGQISEKIQRGKNTTRRAEMFVVEDIRVLDTAGFSLLEMEEVMDPVLLKEAYPEFEPMEGQCRFQPCYHDREPGCAVTDAVLRGAIPEARVQRYRRILADVRTNWKERYQ